MPVKKRERRANAAPARGIPVGKMFAPRSSGEQRRADGIGSALLGLAVLAGLVALVIHLL